MPSGANSSMPLPTGSPPYNGIKNTDIQKPIKRHKLKRAARNSLCLIHNRYRPNIVIKELVDSRHTSCTLACASQSGFNKCVVPISISSGPKPAAISAIEVKYLLKTNLDHCLVSFLLQIQG